MKSPPCGKHRNCEQLQRACTQVRTDQQSGALNGYAVTKKGPGGADGVYAATPRWSMTLRSSSTRSRLATENL